MTANVARDCQSSLREEPETPNVYRQYVAKQESSPALTCSSRTEGSTNSTRRIGSVKLICPFLSHTRSPSPLLSTPRDVTNVGYVFHLGLMKKIAQILMKSPKVTERSPQSTTPIYDLPDLRQRDSTAFRGRHREIGWWEGSIGNFILKAAVMKRLHTRIATLC